MLIQTAVLLVLTALAIHGVCWAARFLVGLFLDHPIILLRTEVEAAAGSDDTYDREEDVRFLSRDGVELRGWLMRSRVQTRRVIAFFHEYGADGTSWARYLSALPALGYHVFTFDFRGAGASQAPAGYRAHKWATSGEVADADAALCWLREQARLYGWDVMAFGASRGAAAMMMAAPGHPWLRVFACEGMSSTMGSIRQYMRRWANIWIDTGALAWTPGALWHFVAHLIVVAAERREQTRFPALEEHLAALHSRRALLAYGARDSLIDATQRRGIVSAFAGQCEVWLMPGTGHLSGPVRFGEEYGRRLHAWFSGEVLPASERAVPSIAAAEHGPALVPDLSA